METCVGWDIGGANLKAVALPSGGGLQVLERPFEIWRSARSLPEALADLGRELNGTRRHAVTMTAELADCYPTKREGVRAVLEGLSRAFPGEVVRVFTTSGTFVSPAEAFEAPLSVAGANWCASAMWLASQSDSRSGGRILVDVGSTTTDIVPVAGGRVRAQGTTDPERLLAGELVYTGALRTPLCAVMRTAPLRGGECPVAAEHFAIAADAHLWLGDLDESEYRCSTPDGGSITREGAAARLARVVCADLEMLAEEEITAIALRAADAQVDTIARSLAHVAGRMAEEISNGDTGTVRVLTAGAGAWLGEQAARRCGLPAEPIASRLGPLARVLPAYAVASLQRRTLHAAGEGGAHLPAAEWPEGGSARRSASPTVVVKVGGSLARAPRVLREVMRALCEIEPAPLIVPGGGPLADAVRALHARGGLSEETAHRMALLSLDQAALWLAELADGVRSARLVRFPDDIEDAAAARALPVLAPARWLERENPLPASWDVTSDAIAAWVASRLGARRLFLLKSFAFERAEVTPHELDDTVDVFFLPALPADLEVRLVDGRDPARVTRALAGASGAATLLRRD